MNPVIAVVALSLNVLVVACAYSDAQPLKKPQVILDYWWLRDYARNSCAAGFVQGDPERTQACGNVDGTIGEFEARLEAPFAANSNCHGVTFLPFGNPTKVNKAQEPDWTLIIDFTPGYDTQGWSLSSHDYKRLLKGSGRIEKIVSDVCGAVTQRGGTVVR